MMPTPWSIRNRVPNGNDRAFILSSMRVAWSGEARNGEPAAGPVPPLEEWALTWLADAARLLVSQAPQVAAQLLRLAVASVPGVSFSPAAVVKMRRWPNGKNKLPRL